MAGYSTWVPRRALTIVLLLGSSVGMAQADRVMGLTERNGVDPDAMRAEMHQYFSGELREGWVFGGLGVVSAVTGAGFLGAGREMHRGAAIPLLVFGAIQLALSIGLVARTPGQLAALDQQLTAAPAEFADQEGARMRRVNQWFPVYRVAEAVFGFAGIALAGAAGVAGSEVTLGAGIALFAEALAMLLLDHFAELRGLQYENALLGFRWD